MSTFLSIPARNVMRNKRRTLVTLTSIAFGLAAVVIIEAYISGFLSLIVDSVVKGRSGALQVHKLGYMKNRSGNPLEFNFPLTPDLIERVRRVPGVTGVTNRVIFSGLITNGRNQTMFMARALDILSEGEVCPNYSGDIAPDGLALAPEDTTSVLVGEELANSLNLRPQSQPETALPGSSDTVTLSSASPEGQQNSLDVAIKGLVRSVAGFESKRVLTVPRALADQLLGLNGRVTELAIAVDDLNAVTSIKDKVALAIGQDFEVHDWREANPFVRDILTRQQVLLGIVSLILFIVVAFGVTNTKLMSVYERVREIGTMMAVGVRRSQIMTIFVVEALIIAVLGSSAGFALAWVTLKMLMAFGFTLPAFGVTSGTQFEAPISLAFVVRAIVLTCAGAALSSIYPAFKASRLDPVEALRSL